MCMKTTKTKALRASLEALLGRPIALDDVHQEMGRHLSEACGARVESVEPTAKHSFILMAASPEARSEAVEVLRLAGHRLDSTQDVPADADEQDYPQGQFWAWFVAARKAAA